MLTRYRRSACVPGTMTAMINYYRANHSAFTNERARAAVIDTPTLMIWGEKDKTLGLELTEGHEAYVCHFSSVRLPGVSHWVQQEAPDLVNHHLAR